MGAIDLYARPSADFERKLAASKALLASAAADYSPLTQASSLGAEDMVVTHLIAETGIASSIFVLDTGMLHPQTLALVGRIEERYGRKVDVYQPDAAVAEKFVAENGAGAMYKSLELRKACCDFRKMVPLERALAGKKAWITGLRREQSQARAEVHDIEQQTVVVDGRNVSRAKVNPLADWTWGDVWHFIALHGIPYNPLHDEFFPSIGCAPCTRAVTLGEDFRSGRWWWEQESAKECGLHVSSDGTHEAEEPAAFEPLSGSLASSPLRRPASIIPIKEIPA
jgi:phosphoadenosine phosphosulfate reductase